MRFANVATLFLFVIAPLANSVVAQSSTFFTYQGELKHNNSPANGDFNMAFSLWTSPIGGSQVGLPVSQPVVPVVDGRFTVEIDFGASVFNNDDRWLQITVDGDTLSPRTAINRSPYAIQTRGIFVNSNEQVGVGTTAPEAPLHIQEGSAGNVDSQANSSAVFERSGQNFLSILSPNNSERGILFGDPDSSVNGGIVYNNSSNPDGFEFRTGGNAVQLVIGAEGNVGIGTNSPGLSSRVNISASPLDDNALFVGSFNDTEPAIRSVNLGLGAAIQAQGGSDTSLAGGGLIIAGFDNANVSIDGNEIMARSNGSQANLFINHEGGDVLFGAASGGSSKIITPVLQITGGSDFSEMFDVGGDVSVEPGMVVVIDPNYPGRLVPSTAENDRKVAGIISGAGGVATGMTMGQDGTIANGEYPVALTGRVYCLVDASEAAIEPGDMLTTSSTPGHAMKVNDLDSAQGAIIGKAMTGLGKGKSGLVLVLVNLQ